MKCRYNNDEWCYLKEQSCEKPNEDCKDFEEEKEERDADDWGDIECHRRREEGL